MPGYPIRTRVRQLTRLVGAGVWTVASYAAWAPGALATLPLRRAARRWNAVATRLWARGVLVAFGVRVDAKGSPPRAPAFLVANHLSWLDILVLGSHLGPTFVSKHEIAGWPVLGHLARVAGTIFVDRGRRRDALRVMREIDRAVDEGARVLLFPEGTSSRGAVVQPLKPALLEWAVRRDHPVHVVAIGYRAGDGPGRGAEVVCWFDNRPFAEHLMDVLALSRIEARLVFAATAARASDRQDLAQRLHQALADHLAAAR